MSEDLINRKKVLESLYDLSIPITEYDGKTGRHLVRRSEVRDSIKNAPTAYDVDKVIEELEEKKENANEHSMQDKSWIDYMNRGYANGISEAIEIVKKGGIE